MKDQSQKSECKHNCHFSTPNCEECLRQPSQKEGEEMEKQKRREDPNHHHKWRCGEPCSCTCLDCNFFNALQLNSPESEKENELLEDKNPFTQLVSEIMENKAKILDEFLKTWVVVNTEGFSKKMIFEFIKKLELVETRKDLQSTYSMRVKDVSIEPLEFQGTLEGWEEQFDKRYVVSVFMGYVDEFGLDRLTSSNEIAKRFIFELLKTQAKKSFKEGSDMQKKKDVEIAKKEWEEFPRSQSRSYDRGYEDALSKIIYKILNQ